MTWFFGVFVVVVFLWLVWSDGRGYKLSSQLVSLEKRKVEKLVELLAVENEIKGLLLKLKDVVIDPAKLDEVLTTSKANRDALAAMVPADQPAV